MLYMQVIRVLGSAGRRGGYAEGRRTMHVGRVRMTWRRIAAIAAVLGTTTAGIILALPDSERQQPKPASTIAFNTRLCLIAKAGDPDAARIWIGIQQAATMATRVNAQQTAIPAYAASDSN